jgi:hypothetical protein
LSTLLIKSKRTLYTKALIKTEQEFSILKA